MNYTATEFAKCVANWNRNKTIATAERVRQFLMGSLDLLYTRPHSLSDVDRDVITRLLRDKAPDYLEAVRAHHLNMPIAYSDCLINFFSEEINRRVLLASEGGPSHLAGVCLDYAHWQMKKPHNEVGLAMKMLLEGWTGKPFLHAEQPTPEAIITHLYGDGVWSFYFDPDAPSAVVWITLCSLPLPFVFESLANGITIEPSALPTDLAP